MLSLRAEAAMKPVHGSSVASQFQDSTVLTLAQFPLSLLSLLVKENRERLTCTESSFENPKSDHERKRR